MNDVPVKIRSIFCGLCKEGHFLTIPQRWGNNSNRIRKSSKGRNRNRKRAVGFIYQNDKLIPVCKDCGFNHKLISLQDKWHEYIVQAMMGI